MLEDIRENFHLLSVFGDPLIHIDIRRLIVQKARVGFLKALTEICLNLCQGNLGAPADHVQVLKAKKRLIQQVAFYYKSDLKLLRKYLLVAKRFNTLGLVVLGPLLPHLSSVISWRSCSDDIPPEQTNSQVVPDKPTGIARPARMSSEANETDQGEDDPIGD